MPVTFSAAIDALNSLAPTRLAEPWDNVGLLLEPSRHTPIRRILLAIDLTRPVADEAIRVKAGLIVAYHPPIFDPLRRLTADHPLTRLIENRVALYSPHTALDAVDGGVNDWLADCFGPRQTRTPIRPANAARPLPAPCVKLVVFVPLPDADKLRDALARAGVGCIGNYSHCSFNAEGLGTFLPHAGTRPHIGKQGKLETVREIRLEMILDGSLLPRAERVIRANHPYEEPAYEFYPLVRPSPDSDPSCGAGRLVSLEDAWPVRRIVTAVKKHLKLKSLRAALCDPHRRGAPVKTIALCAGAGGSLLKDARADLLLTGEMRHHDVLAANARGASVILCDHTHTERGYLPLLRRKLLDKLGKSADIQVSKADREPLEAC